MNGEKEELINKIAKFLPSVEKPTYKPTFNQRIMWVAIALVSYLVLSYVSVYGVAQGGSQLGQFLSIQLLLGARFGSLMTLGISPIVTAGILLQLLVGSKIISWDMTKPESRKKFQTWNKFAAIVLAFVEGFFYVVAGALGPEVLTQSPLVIALVIAQLAAGGIIVILLDELVSKWGFGSGVSLFIAAGVGSQILIRALSPFPFGCQPGNLYTCFISPSNPPSGLLWEFFINAFSGRTFDAIVRFIPLLMTAVVFLIAIYIQDIKINIPLAFSSLRGFGRNWGLKLLYTSNIPIILTGALIANMQLLGRLGTTETAQGIVCSLLGCFDTATNYPISGLVYYLYIPSHITFPAIILYNDIFRFITYTLFLAISATMFSVFWVSTSGMDSASVANQIESTGMHIPGYRSDKKTIEMVLKRYIPSLAVLGGLIIGLLSAFADLTGAIGSGTGILLMTMIIFNYYEELSNQKLEGAHPLIRKALGE